LKRDGPRHKHDHADHSLRLLTPQEKEQFSANIFSATSGEYVFEFGKHKKKSFSWVEQHHPSYLQWCVQEAGICLQYPLLRDALASKGYLPQKFSTTLAPKCFASVVSNSSTAFLPAVAQTTSLEMVEAGNPHETAKQSRKQQAHNKYMPLGQRSQQYNEQPKCRARAPVELSGLTLKRMSPWELTTTMLECGLFENLEGKPCPNPLDLCQSKKTGFSNESVLGALTCAAKGKEPGANISNETVCYRCSCCRARVPVVFNNPFFPSSGKGSYSPSLGVMVYHMTLEDFTPTQIARELNVTVDWVAPFMERARYAMARAAMIKQQQIKFGHLPNGATCIVEADETVIDSFMVPPESEGDQKSWWWYTFLGLKARGQPESLWLKNMGLRQSHGEPRPPQLTISEWVAALNEAGLEQGSNIVLCTDSCPAYQTLLECLCTNLGQ
jgi:hypothetical protein